MAQNNKYSTQIDFSRLRCNLISKYIPGTIKEIKELIESDTVETQNYK